MVDVSTLVYKLSCPLQITKSQFGTVVATWSVGSETQADGMLYFI